MAQQTIDLESLLKLALGPIRTNGARIQDNFDELYAALTLSSAYITKAIDYTALITDRTIEVTVAEKTITLPTTASAVVGFQYVIDNSSIGDVYVVGEGGETIQGEAQQTVPSNSCISVYSNGTAWRIN